MASLLKVTIYWTLWLRGQQATIHQHFREVLA
jgi:hypothetical protein